MPAPVASFSAMRKEVTLLEMALGCLAQPVEEATAAPGGLRRDISERDLQALDEAKLGALRGLLPIETHENVKVAVGPIRTAHQPDLPLGAPGRLFRSSADVIGTPCASHARTGLRGDAASGGRKFQHRRPWSRSGLSFDNNDIGVRSFDLTGAPFLVFGRTGELASEFCSCGMHSHARVWPLCCNGFSRSLPSDDGLISRVAGR